MNKTIKNAISVYRMKNNKNTWNADLIDALKLIDNAITKADKVILSNIAKANIKNALQSIASQL